MLIRQIQFNSAHGGQGEGREHNFYSLKSSRRAWRAVFYLDFLCISKGKYPENSRRASRAALHLHTLCISLEDTTEIPPESFARRSFICIPFMFQLNTP